MRPVRIASVLGFVSEAQDDLLCVATQILELPKSDCYAGVIVPNALMAELRAVVRDLDGTRTPRSAA